MKIARIGNEKGNLNRERLLHHNTNVLTFSDDVMIFRMEEAAELQINEKKIMTRTNKKFEMHETLIITKNEDIWYGM